MRRLLALFAGLFVVTGAACQQRSTEAMRQGNPQSTSGSAKRTVLTPPEAFGYKTAWFAVRSKNTKAVAAAFKLKNIAPASWEYGIDHAYGPHTYGIFVTPPVKGWTLVMGLPIMLGETDKRLEQAAKLSRRFGEVQFYCNYRVSGVYVWGRAINGRVVRLFAEEDGDRREIGPRSDVEKPMLAKFFDDLSPEAKQPGDWDRTDLTMPDEDDVLKVAAAWSVNPNQLEEMSLPPALGLLGDPPPGYYETI